MQHKRFQFQNVGHSVQKGSKTLSAIAEVRLEWYTFCGIELHSAVGIGAAGFIHRETIAGHMFIQFFATCFSGVWPSND